jgi:hypothetical protein
LTKKNAQLRVEEKNKKNKTLQRTQHCRQPAAKSPHTKAQRRRVCGSANVLRHKKRHPFIGLTKGNKKKKSSSDKHNWFKIQLSFNQFKTII